MLLLVHKALNSLAHYYISDLFSVYNPIRPLRSPGANLVTIRSKCAECFSYCGPFLWNTFSAVTTVSTFRKKLSFWESLSVLTGLSYIHTGSHLLIAYRIKADSSLLADIPCSSCLGDHLMYLCIYYQVTYQSTVIFTLTGSCFSCPLGSWENFISGPMQVYKNWLIFGTSTKWLLKELQPLGTYCKPRQ